MGMSGESMPQSQVAMVVNRVCRDLIAGGEFNSIATSVPQFIRDRTSPNPLFACGFDDFLNTTDPETGQLSDTLVARVRWAVAKSPELWAVPACSPSPDVRFFEHPVVLNKIHVMVNCRDMDSAKSYLTTILTDGFRALAAIVVEGCKDFEPAEATS